MNKEKDGPITPGSHGWTQGIKDELTNNFAQVRLNMWKGLVGAERHWDIKDE